MATLAPEIQQGFITGLLIKLRRALDFADPKAIFYSDKPNEPVTQIDASTRRKALFAMISELNALVVQLEKNGIEKLLIKIQIGNNPSELTIPTSTIVFHQPKPIEDAEYELKTDLYPTAINGQPVEKGTLLTVSLKDISDIN